jgi:tetrahydromethanopterin S-methyltransferase subunit F
MSIAIPGGGGAPPQPHRMFTRGVEIEERRLSTSWKGIVLFVVVSVILIIIFILLAM